MAMPPIALHRKAMQNGGRADKFEAPTHWRTMHAQINDNRHVIVEKVPDLGGIPEMAVRRHLEGPLLLHGYRSLAHNFEVAAFGRNITDEENIKGFIDFSNNTGFVNEPRILGVEAIYNF